ncbi:MAG: DNA-formamidopyrimidine glycosylase family protein, partial [Streptococcus sp.]|nr:DNA-formamidopyrimidine glycosylase family protein [Streptococcus sp.]
MPELPEVETVRRGLEKLILGKTIQSVEVKYPKMIQTDLDTFRQDLPG